MRRLDRTIDPTQGRGIRDQRRGAIPERELRDQQRTSNRFDREEHPFVLGATLGPWFRENIAASATSSMRLLALGTSSTNPGVAALVYNGTAGGGSAMTMANPVRVVAGVLHTPQTITAGSITLGVMVGSTTTAITDAKLDTANTISVMAWLDWESGIVVPAGVTVAPVLIGSSALSPTTADVSAWLVIAREQPGGSGR